MPQGINHFFPAIGSKVNSCHDNLGQFCSGGGDNSNLGRITAATWIDNTSEEDINIHEKDDNAFRLMNYGQQQDMSFDEKATFTKDLVCSNLSEKTGFEYEEVNKAIHNWAETSNDNHYASLSMQKSAADLFGVNLSDWQKEKIDGFSPVLTIRQKNTIPWKSGNLDNNNNKFLQAMYDETQNKFKDEGISQVTLYRGIALDDVSKFEIGKPVKLDMNAMESWSADPRVAEQFGNLTVKAVIPANRIVGGPTTGFGCLREYEFIVLGGKNNEVLVVNAQE